MGVANADVSKKKPCKIVAFFYQRVKKERLVCEWVGGYEVMLTSADKVGLKKVKNMLT